ncbi:MAG: adenylate/guanylate cyclase domain-containing protein [Coriobacteriia bacterium]|nr:adenylate/guanylate cyclase domain-containing protein [Coriobacteriia bacterium]
MAQQRRKNERVLVVLRAVGMAIITAAALTAMHARPVSLPLAVAAVVGGIALASTELAVLVAVMAFSVPVIAVQPVLGFALLIILVASVRFLGAQGGRGFLILGISLLGAFIGPVWAGLALAGYLLGAGEGALVAVVACLLVEATGVGLGRTMIGATWTGGPAHAIIDFTKMPATLLSSQWVANAFTSLDAKSVSKTLDSVTKLSHPLALFLQPWAWAFGAATAGLLQDVARKKRSLMLSIVAVSAGVLVGGLGSAAVSMALGMPVIWQWVATSIASSLVLVIIFAAVWERLFPRVKVVSKAPRRMTMATEDADVDELLRLIATAEDQLATNHTSQRTVMITDMKSFSRMTEEDGSVASAKAIQRHRDLLLPVIQRYNGAGKSTGGDGLVAAFESSADALMAAADMQRTLGAHNTAHSDDREIFVRIGMAYGEVVMDKGGRPFIGTGLNLAARVMNLADGGQVFATSDVASAAANAGVTPTSFGEFELKNIAKPVEIVEILWEPDQRPHDPRVAGAPVLDDDA